MATGFRKDHGWAWMVVVGAFLVNMLVVGVTAKSFGILFERLKEKLEHSSSATLFVVAISQCLAMVLGPFANMLMLKFTSRWVVFAGGIVIAFGFLTSMLTTTIYQLYFTYGILVGIGSALSYAPSIVTTTQYFDKRKALANGIAVAGGGIGNFIAPHLMQLLLDLYHLDGAFLILAAIMLHICISGALFRPIPYQVAHPAPPPSIVDRLNHKHGDTCETLCHTDSVQLLPKPPERPDKNTQAEPQGERETQLESNSSLTGQGESCAPSTLNVTEEAVKDDGYGTESSHVTAPSEGSGEPSPTLLATGNGELHQQAPSGGEDGCMAGWCRRAHTRCCYVTTPTGHTRPVFEWQLIKNRVFLVYGFSMFFAFSGYPNIFMIIMSHAKYLKIDSRRATFLISIVGISDVVGRVGFGWFSDLNLIKKKYGFMITMAVAGLACELMPVVGDSYTGLAVLCAVFGLFAGSFYALLPAILVEGLGEKKLLSAFGLVTLFMGTAFIYATVVVGYLNDLTGQWNASFHFSGTAMILGSLIVLLEPLAVKHENKKLVASQADTNHQI